MGHDWIIDVLQDLKSYALANGMPQLAETAAEALKVAEAEISAKIDTHLPPKDLPRQ